MKATPPSPAPKPTLPERFTRLQDPSSKYTDEQLRALELSALGRFKVQFGKTAVGLSFQEAVETNPGWTRWVLEHLSESPKREHRTFMLYVERYLEEAEQTEKLLLDGAPDQPLPDASSDDRGYTQGRMTEEPWSLVANRPTAYNEVQGQVNELAQRMSQMEGLVQQMLGAIQQLTPSGQS